MNDVDNIIAWFKLKGFVWDDHLSIWSITWPYRTGYDYLELRFDFIDHDKTWDAIVSCHSSGLNPKIVVGQCNSLEDIERIYTALRLINGYPIPEEEYGKSDYQQ